EPVLDVLRPGGEDVNMIVSVVSNGVTSLVKLFHPTHILLLEDLPDREEMNDSAVGFDPAGGFERVCFGLRVEVALLVVPVQFIPGGKIARHLQIQSDGD